MPVDISGAQRKARSMMDVIAAAAEEAFINGRQAVIASALSRTPTADEEYNVLMTDADGVSEVPRGMGGSADNDKDAPDRRRLIKDDATWLQSVVPSPENQSVIRDDGLIMFQFGNIPVLAAATMYSWQNANTKGAVGDQQFSKSYFNNFEYGTAGVRIAPRFSRQGDSKPYPLRPDYTRTPMFMYKPVRPYRIFGFELLQPLFEQNVAATLSQYGPGHGRAT